MKSAQLFCAIERKLVPVDAFESNSQGGWPVKPSQKIGRHQRRRSAVQPTNQLDLRYHVTDQTIENCISRVHL